MVKQGLPDGIHGVYQTVRIKTFFYSRGSVVQISSKPQNAYVLGIAYKIAFLKE